jgi:predicted type IV restriction endonuclease
MTETFDQGKEEVAKLCQCFTTNRQAFLTPGVKEANLRQSVIDPFFEALGRDVGNTSMIAPQGDTYTHEQGTIRMIHTEKW